MQKQVFQNKEQKIKYLHYSASAFVDLQMSLHTTDCNKNEFDSLEFVQREHGSNDTHFGAISDNMIVEEESGSKGEEGVPHSTFEESNAWMNMCQMKKPKWMKMDKDYKKY